MTAVLLAAVCVPAKSALPDDERQVLIEAVLKKFLGPGEAFRWSFRAKASEEERRTVPITNEVVHRALDAGKNSQVSLSAASSTGSRTIAR